MEKNETKKPIYINDKKDENEVSKLGNVLRKIVEQKGMEIYSKLDQLSLLLVEENIDTIQIKQVELVLVSSTFLRYLKQLSEGISAVDINNIVQTATNGGMTVKVARKIVSDLLYGIGISQKLGSEYFPENCKAFVREDFYMNPKACDVELNRIENLIIANEELTESEFSFLNYCSLAGIPTAKRIIGKMFLFGYQMDKNLKRAEICLENAASAGDAEAMSLLGDLYYTNEHYNEAYEMLTGPGTYAVNKQQQQIVKKLCKIKEFNGKQIVIWSGVAILIELLMLFVMSTSPITGKHGIATTICSLMNFGIIALMVWEKLKKPFSDLRKYGLLFVAIVFIYSFSYILL